MLYELKTLDRARRQHYISADFRKCVTSMEEIAPYVGVLNEPVAVSLLAVKQTK
jgi:hypothetical protein